MAFDKRKVIKLPSGNYVYADAIVGYSAEHADATYRAQGDAPDLFYVECIGTKVLGAEYWGGREYNAFVFMNVDALREYVEDKLNEEKDDR